jgi:hypothetical protein
MSKGLLGACLLFSAVFALVVPARADEEPDALFASAVKALRDGRAGEAVDGFESLADRGVVDPVLSFDRGLAYAMRVRIGAEVPGDLGRAAQGFEEARDLSRDSRLAEEASLALGVLRSEVAKRRARAGDPTEVDPGPSLGRAVAALLSEDVWALMASIASAVLGLGLFVRWVAGARRARVTGGVAAGVAMPVLAVAVAMTLAARHDRATLREAVVVTTSARPSDERGITRPGATPLPEGARVEVVEVRGPFSRVRFGGVDAWVATGALRELARRG